MNQTIFTVIVTWNGMKWLKECMDSIRRSTVPVKTIVIDNGSTDDTCDFISRNYPEVILCRAGKNLGFGQANNVGIRYAYDNGADYVYLLNQDAYIYPDMFERLLAVAEDPSHSNLGILSPLHVHGSRAKLDAQFKGYLRAIGTDFIEDKSVGQPKDVYCVECVPAAGWFIPRSTIEKIGGFDPIFFHYGEDHHYAYRINYHGLKVGVVPSAMMVHDREDFGNATMAKKGAVLRNLETEVYLNINNSLGRQLYMFFNKYFFFVVYSGKEIARGNGRLVLQQIAAIGKSIVRIPKYCKNRKANKKQGMLWLQRKEIVELAGKIGKNG